VTGLPTDDPSEGPGADHFGSALAICNGFLFVSIGDTASLGADQQRPFDVQARVQLPEHAEGKILRYALSNGELEPAGILHDDPPVFAMGFRNPFGMTCDPESGLPIVVDNGPNGHDQLRLVELGSNHEWPLTEDRSDRNPPAFDSGLAQLAPTSVIARTGVEGTEIIFGSFHTQALYRPRVISAADTTEELELILRAPEAVLAMADGADGCVYLSDASRIWRLDGLGCGRPEVTSAPDGSVAFEGPAEEVYQRSCAACPGFDRSGGQSHAPPLTSETLTDADNVCLNAILAGRPESVMPSWAAAGMTVEQARRLLDYLRSGLPEQ
jgi:mono/diheme cytochrome c family protein